MTATETHATARPSDDPDAPARPVYLSGQYAPVPDEIDAYDLPVSGHIPPQLRGRYLRNGPNPLPGTDPGHWFAGAGMLHGVRLEDGRARWYRNRWVRTERLAGRPFRREDGSVDRTAVSANTHIVEHGGRLLALVENGFPYEVDRDLGTVGPYDFDGRLTTAMTAHPKTDPVTGDLHFFGYSSTAPYLTYHRADAAGRLVASRTVDVPAPTMMHDFAITARHVVWLDLPIVHSADRQGSPMPYAWDEGYGARLGVMRQDDPAARVQWFDVDPCYVFHVGTACEDEHGRIVLDGARYAPADVAVMWHGARPDPALGSGLHERAAATGSATMHRWTLDPATGTVTETPLSERSTEFPTLDETRTGRAARYRYAVSGGGATAILKVDVTGADATTARELGPDVAAGEAVFVPAEDPDGGGGRREDDGWLLSIVTHRRGGGSRLLVLDASDVTRTVATVELPRRVPAGFHGSWLPDDAADGDGTGRDGAPGTAAG